MAVRLNHTIVPVRDKRQSAAFITDVLGLDPPKPLGPFMCVETANGVSLDYDDRWEVTSHHYAFLVTEPELDEILARVKERGLTYWADPGHNQPNTLNDNGRGFYFEDPDGHNMEVLTRAAGG
jgi:catechol 2,3-dioxygenase-like lactoylglutathione lyase family enzyme